MNMTIENNTINTLEEKLKGDMGYLRDQLAFARRTPEKMTAFYGFSFISANHLDNQTVELLFMYEGKVLIHALLHHKTVSFYKFGLENYVLSEEETLQLFENIKPTLEELAFYLS